MSEDRTRVAGSSAGASATDSAATRITGTPAAPIPVASAAPEAFGAPRRAAVPPPVQVGEVLGHTYRIEAFLAKGGMGAVYRARHVVLESEHAIKIILAELSEDPQVIALLNQEAKTLRTVKNDAVVEYQGLMLDEHGRRYLVMEFVDGPSLATLLRDRRFTPAEVRTLRQRLGLGLAAAHDKGIFHRDISPDNIILPGERIENAKIIDFGIAKSTATGEKTIIGGDFAGKYSYASPEQAGMHGGKVDARSDIYSLGLVLASAAIGHGGKLDMGNSLSSVFEARQKVPDLSELPAELRDEIAAMLQPKPADRPQSMQEVVGLGATTQRHPTAAVPARAASAASSGQRSSARIVVAAALSFAAVVAVGAAYFLLSPPAVKTLAPPPEAAKPQTPELAQQPPPAPTVPALPPPTVAAAPAPIPAPIAPAQPQLDVAQIRPVLDSFPCADLKASVAATGDLDLRGFVSMGGDRKLLRDRLGAIPGARRVIDDAVAAYDWPQCRQMVNLLADTASAAGAAAPQLQFNAPDLVYRNGEPLIIDVTTAGGGYLTVDFFDDAGGVLHLLPNEQQPQNATRPGESISVGRDRQGNPMWGTGEPFGPNLVIAVASPAPLMEMRKKAEERADAYIQVLTRALRAASVQGEGRRVVSAYKLINTVPR